MDLHISHQNQAAKTRKYSFLSDSELNDSQYDENDQNLDDAWEMCSLNNIPSE